APDYCIEGRVRASRYGREAPPGRAALSQVPRARLRAGFALRFLNRAQDLARRWGPPFLSLNLLEMFLELPLDLVGEQVDDRVKVLGLLLRRNHGQTARLDRNFATLAVFIY